jgi:hypothetical protein
MTESHTSEQKDKSRESERLHHGKCLLKMEANRGNLMETEEPIQASRGY